ncbi:flagellar motor protein MotB [Thermoproteota archaeon]
MKNKLKKFTPIQRLEADSEINTIYGDMISFVMMLFILLFVLSYNKQTTETFFTEMRLTFGAKKIEQEKILTSEELFVSKLQGYIKKEKLEDKAKVLVDEQRIKLILAPAVLFDTGKAILKPQGVQMLNKLAEIFMDVQNPITIEGHTDNVPIHNVKYDSNWDLSFDRAYTVVKYFIHKHKFSPRQLSAHGYGEFQPLVPNDSITNRSKNRRIEINIIRVTSAASLESS